MINGVADRDSALSLAFLAKAAVACADALTIQHAGIAALALDHDTRACGQGGDARRGRLQSGLEGGQLHLMAGTSSANSSSSRPG